MVCELHKCLREILLWFTNENENADKSAETRNSLYKPDNVHEFQRFRIEVERVNAFTCRRGTDQPQLLCFSSLCL
ncbi:hypothetical protein RB195_007335 [Necator americanus]|uniref:Uncharacterized protein n=1 Tax=Necator americanus TaxID=51031 RepID=A0ABR1C0C9_NECAM